MRKFAVVLLLFSAPGVFTGCAVTDAGKNIADSSLDVLKPNARDYRDTVNDPAEFHDEWSEVGRDGRGSTAREHEWDKLTPVMMSPKAMAVERNLGFGY